MGSRGCPNKNNNSNLVVFTLVVVVAQLAHVVRCEDPYIYETWDVRYSTLYPLGVPQQVITINDQFPGPRINGTSNNNVVVNIFNNLDEPLLFTWNGIQQRKNSWIDGTAGTNCPIAPGTNFTMKFQMKDQIGTFYYYPTTSLHRISGAHGAITVHSRELIPVPFPWPEEEYVALVADWYTKDHLTYKRTLDSGRPLGPPNGVIINGAGSKREPMFYMAAGRVYRYRFCNVGTSSTINVRIQGHMMKLVEVEGSHTVHNLYDSLDVHLGQCYSVLVTADQPPKDYFLVASTRFTKDILTATAIIHYNDSHVPASPELPKAPAEGIVWSLNQFRSFRWNLTASAARPNPQGSYHYGKINITRTIRLVNSANTVDGKLRYAINGISHVNTETPLKLAEYFGMADKVFQYDLVKDEPGPDAETKIMLAPSVVNATYRNYVEVILENHEKTTQYWHLAGFSFFAVAIEPGRWSPDKRKNYNLVDALSRNTIPVFPGHWGAIMLTFDNCGMWNLRSVSLERQYLGQELYVSVLSPEKSLRDEYHMPETMLACGIVKGLPIPQPYATFA